MRKVCLYFESLSEQSEAGSNRTSSCFDQLGKKRVAMITGMAKTLWLDQMSVRKKCEKRRAERNPYLFTATLQSMDAAEIHVPICVHEQITASPALSCARLPKTGTLDTAGVNASLQLQLSQINNPLLKMRRFMQRDGGHTVPECDTPQAEGDAREPPQRRDAFTPGCCVRGL